LFKAQQRILLRQQQHWNQRIIYTVIIHDIGILYIKAFDIQIHLELTGRVTMKAGLGI
jgi:hypothetical protein